MAPSSTLWWLAQARRGPWSLEGWRRQGTGTTQTIPVNYCSNSNNFFSKCPPDRGRRPLPLAGRRPRRGPLLHGVKLRLEVLAGALGEGAEEMQERQQQSPLKMQFVPPVGPCDGGRPGEEAPRPRPRRQQHAQLDAPREGALKGLRRVGRHAGREQGMDIQVR